VERSGLAKKRKQDEKDPIAKNMMGDGEKRPDRRKSTMGREQAERIEKHKEENRQQ